LSGQGTDEKQVGKLQKTMKDISNRYSALTNDIGAQTTGLQMAITQSQDVSQAMDSLLNWLDQVRKEVWAICIVLYTLHLIQKRKENLVAIIHFCETVYVTHCFMKTLLLTCVCSNCVRWSRQ
jgi:hypothetical protein